MNVEHLHHIHEGEKDQLNSSIQRQDGRLMEESGENEEKRIDEAPAIKQLVGPFTIVCLFLNYMIGSGVFAIPPTVLAGTDSVAGAIITWAFGGVVVICGILCWLELTSSTSFYTITDNVPSHKFSEPRSGGEKNYLEHILETPRILERPKMLMTFAYGLLFVFLGNLSGNAVAFGIYATVAIGKDPIYDMDNTKGLVLGFAIVTISISAALHIFMRQGTIVMNNILAIIKFAVILVLAVFGFVHGGGKYAHYHAIREPYTPNLNTSNISITLINNGTSLIFSSPFAKDYHNFGNYVDSFLFAIISYTGLGPPLRALSDITWLKNKASINATPKAATQKSKIPKYALLVIIITILSYTILSAGYLYVDPQPGHAADPALSLYTASVLLDYLSDVSYTPEVAGRITAALVAVFIFGNILVITFIAARLKTEIAKEGILPYSSFLASGRTSFGNLLKHRLLGRPRQLPKQITDDIDQADCLHNGPVAALSFHWIISISLILVTASLTPSAQYNMLTTFYNYLNLTVFGFLVSVGLLYFKIDCYLSRRGKGRGWSPTASFVPWISPVHVVIYLYASIFLIFASCTSPNLRSIDDAYGRFDMFMIVLASVFTGLGLWLGLGAFELWRRRIKPPVARIPYIEKYEEDTYVQKVELITYHWLTFPDDDIGWVKDSDEEKLRRISLQVKPRDLKSRLLGQRSSLVQGRHELDNGTTYTVYSQKRLGQIAVQPATEAVDLSLTDRVKNAIQGLTAKPINWWPLVEPKRSQIKDQRQILWQCPVCPDRVPFDVSKDLAGALEDLLAAGRTHTRGNISNTGTSNEGTTEEVVPPDISLTYSSSASTLASSLFSPGVPLKKPSRQRPQRQYPEEVYHMSSSSSRESTVAKWIHWCVGSRRPRARDICVQGPPGAKTGQSFLLELKRIYKKLRGLRYWLSFTTLSRVKVVKFVRLLDGQDLVLCDTNNVTPKEINAMPGYEITIDEKLDESWHVVWVETALNHFMQQHSSMASDRDINAIISGLPKKTGGCIDRQGREIGYGIRSIQGWSLLRFISMAAICIVLGLIFFCAWLGKHPGDLQNASIPYFMLLAPFTLVGILDAYIE